VQAGILPADSDVTLEMAGLTEGQRQRVRSDRRRASGRSVLDRLAALGSSADEVQSPEVVDGDVGFG
jgi:hypothetical protein